jgi:hypothetical protein
MDLTAITTLVTSLKTASEMAKTIVDIRNQTEIQSKVIDIQGALMSAQNSALAATTAQFELMERVRQLEAQLKTLQDGQAQKARYALVNPFQGAQTYALKEAHANGEAPHFACVNCFDNNSKRSLLNVTKDKSGREVFACPNCNVVVETGFRGGSEAKYAEAYSSGPQ